VVASRPMPEAERAAGSGRLATPASPAPRLRLAYVIGRLDRALRRHLDEAIRPHGLTTPQYTTLSVLRARDGLSNAQLARRSLMTPQSMSEVITALVEKGFVRREASPAHGRIMHTRLTRAGAAALAACDEAVDEIEAEMLHELSPAEAERLLSALASCVRMLGAGLSDI